jgi:hypothetical protein
VETDHRQLAGHGFLIMINHKADLPEPVLGAMVGWAERAHPQRASTPPAEVAPATTRFETPLFFGAGDLLFGILNEPVGTRHRQRPAILLLNAGTVHRMGPHRMYVRLARHWAGLGFCVLRMDLSGIGDSPAAEGCPENLCYPRDRLADVEAAMDAIERRLGATRFVLVGLCSGADIAFKSALASERVAGTVMMNPRTFCVHDLELVETYKRANYYLQTLLDHGKVLRLLRGQVDVRRALGMLAANVRRAWRRRHEAARSKETKSDVPEALRQLARRGVDTLLVASEHDPGVEYVDRHFGRGMRALEQVAGFRRADFHGTDHTFTSLFAQERVAETITHHLLARHP